jgi:hypothetical protein
MDCKIKLRWYDMHYHISRPFWVNANKMKGQPSL